MLKIKKLKKLFSIQTPNLHLQKELPFMFSYLPSPTLSFLPPTIERYRVTLREVYCFLLFPASVGVKPLFGEMLSQTLCETQAAIEFCFIDPEAQCGSLVSYFLTNWIETIQKHSVEA